MLGGLKRAPLVTRFFTVYFSGDASNPRAAETGFEARVDIDKTLWGFCPTTVFVASDCGFAGSNGEFCTTAELYLTGGIGPFSYISCSGSPSTNRYSAFTITPAPTLTSSSTSTSTPLLSSPSLQTSSSPTTRPPNTSAASRASETTTVDAPSQPSHSGANNTGAIIGGVAGCVALLCTSGIAALWLVRRQRGKSNPSSRLEPATPPVVLAPAACYSTGPPRELDHQSAGSGESVVRKPVELPATWAA